MVFTSWYVLNYAFVCLRPSSWFFHRVPIGFQSHSRWKTYFTSRKPRTQSSLISHPLPSIPLVAQISSRCTAQEGQKAEGDPGNAGTEQRRRRRKATTTVMDGVSVRGVGEEARPSHAKRQGRGRQPPGPADRGLVEREKQGGGGCVARERRQPRFLAVGI
jgi:hypothetical protein